MSFNAKVTILLWVITFVSASLAIWINIGPGMGP
jgi:hypothetical protein